MSNWTKLDFAYDHRHQQIQVGDEVVFLGKGHVTDGPMGVVNVHPPRMCVGKVKSLEIEPGTGFAEIGPNMRMYLVCWNATRRPS